MSYCLIFPGQGTQFPGMSTGLDLDAVLDSGLLALMDKGPQEELDHTLNAQPAVLAVSIALWERSGLGEPTAVMGHSLGEYSALVVAACLRKDEAVDLVMKRAAFMDASMPPGSGGMAAVMGLSQEETAEAISQLEDIWVANLNGGSQVVISGNVRSLSAAAPLLKERGAKRVIPLKVSIASHCPYMEKAKISLAGHLRDIHLAAPACPVISNASAQPEKDPERIRTLLAEQLVSPVRFEESVRNVADMGIRRFVEIGPRSVLAPLVKRILPGVEVEVITSDAR
jgi:[acyl-carrier-protein] S-malonyltransferase